ncbi:MAG: hypothetical protein AB7S38_22345 [Vulcanimicrobiota bacterium]
MKNWIVLLCLALAGPALAEESWTLQLRNLQGGASLHRFAVALHSDGTLYFGSPPGLDGERDRVFEIGGDDQVRFYYDSDYAVTKSVRLTPAMAAGLRDAWLGSEPESLDNEYPSAIEYACGTSHRVVVVRQGEGTRRWSLDHPEHSAYDAGVRRFLLGWKALLDRLPEGWAAEFDEGIARHTEPRGYQVDGLGLGTSLPAACEHLGEPLEVHPLQPRAPGRVVVWAQNLAFFSGTRSLQGLSGRVVEFEGRRLEVGMTREQVAEVLNGEAPRSLYLMFDEEGKLKALYAGLDEPGGPLRELVGSER